MHHGSGQASLLLLVSGGSSIREPVLRLAGERVSVTGRMVRRGDALRLQTASEAIHSLEVDREGRSMSLLNKRNEEAGASCRRFFSIAVLGSEILQRTRL